MRKLKLLGVLLCAAVLVFSVSAANAKLLGVEGKLGDPDIIFNNEGFIDYTASEDSFYLQADDWKIRYGDGRDPDYMTGPGFKTRLVIDIEVDELGNLNGCEMYEKVIDGSITVDGNTYGTGSMLLSGNVTAFGWGESGDDLGKFDFIIDLDDGHPDLLVDAGTWPDDVPTAIWAEAEDLFGWTGSWECDFFLDKVKGDKGPIPEPATMLLLGSGLVGLAGLGRKKLFKK